MSEKEPINIPPTYPEDCTNVSQDYKELETPSPRFLEGYFICPGCELCDVDWACGITPSIKGDKKMDEQILEGLKKDSGKPRWELVPYDAIKGPVEVLTMGALKYSARNWELGIMYGRVFGAIQRHLTAWWMGESTDAESGKSHLDHAMCELMFLSAYEKRGMTKFDDRPGK